MTNTWDARVNLVHRGEALDALVNHLRSAGSCSDRSRLLCALPPKTRQAAAELLAYIDDTGMPLLETLEASQRLRRQFRRLRCRGFSHDVFKDFSDESGSRLQLSRRTNLRIGLTTDPRLFYPPAVRREIDRLDRDRNHFIAGMPSVAFAVGVRDADCWWILGLQSDMASHPAAAVREHFRGWRRVLFAHIVSLARPSVRRVYLPQATELECPAGRPTSPIWIRIYGGTACDWKMTSVALDEPMDIQVLRSRPPVQAQHFYALDLEEA